MDHQQVQADEDNLIIATNTHEAIISHEVFEAVKAYRRQVCEESKAHEVDPYTPNIFKGESVLRPLWRQPPSAAQ